MAQKFLDQAGVATLWAKVKANTAAAQSAATTAAGNLTVNGKKLSTSPVLNAGDVNAIPTTQKGAANGVASLDASGKVPQAQLPSYVDDVLEYDVKDNAPSGKTAFPATGEAGKIYVAKDTNKTYRWGGSAYVEISQSLAIGTTVGTAYDGKAGADLAAKVSTMQTTLGDNHTHKSSAVTSMEGYAKAAAAGAIAATDTLNVAIGKLEKSLDTKASGSATATGSAAGLMSAADKAKLDGIEAQANKYVLPTASATVLGGVKVGANLTITNGVLAGTPDTTYVAATASADGLMSSADKAKLDGITALTDTEINAICV